MNRENLDKLINHMAQLEPEQFEMSEWCGTACCIAGHTAILLGIDPIFETGVFSPFDFDKMQELIVALVLVLEDSKRREGG